MLSFSVHAVKHCFQQKIFQLKNNDWAKIPLYDLENDGKRHWVQFMLEKKMVQYVFWTPRTIEYPTKIKPLQNNAWYEKFLVDEPSSKRNAPKIWEMAEFLYKSLIDLYKTNNLQFRLFQCFHDPTWTTSGKHFQLCHQCVNVLHIIVSVSSQATMNMGESKKTSKV